MVVDPDLWEEGGSSRNGRRKRGGAAVIVSLLFLLAVIGGGCYFGYAKLQGHMPPPDYSGQGTGTVTVEVVKGDSTAHVGRTLQKAGAVKSVEAFTNAAGVKLQTLQPGFYRVRKGMSAESAVAALLDPASRIGVVNVPEGRWASEVYALLSEATEIPVKEFEKVDPASLGLPESAKGKVEGYLYPGRYDLPPDATASQLLAMMVGRFKQETQKVDFSRGQALGLDPAEVVTVASLIEAEAGRPEDRAMISRVLHNRLKIGMPLQFDPALLYAWQKRTIDVRERHQDIDSPYNLYRHKGLPPGPISNPGVAAIEAAMSPADGKWLYFVTTNPTERRTEYATSYGEFLKLKAKFDQWLRDNPQPQN
ncbi:endolytic transglycosylase MltG [Actinocorallia populi]|uniref:endolytic transglycosylase MltG n=1 Tax=Actinocorallia populi TaxID=2079200 RepID=UPI0013006674|nr:endolytic transglycosylase MltG [Actinocorallia populi]